VCFRLVLCLPKSVFTAWCRSRGANLNLYRVLYSYYHVPLFCRRNCTRPTQLVTGNESSFCLFFFQLFGNAQNIRKEPHLAKTKNLVPGNVINSKCLAIGFTTKKSLTCVTFNAEFPLHARSYGNGPVVKLQYV